MHFRKGLSDLIVTLIKVNMGYAGVSLSEEFKGVPILNIDIECVALDVGLCVWAWTTI